MNEFQTKKKQIIDELLATTDVALALSRTHGSRELALAITKLQEAHMWLRVAKEKK